MKVIRAASSEAESKYIYAALADFSRDGARAEYAAWLKAQGRKEDAQAVLATIDVFQSLDARPLEEFDSESPWARMIAIPLLTRFIEMTSYDKVDAVKAVRDMAFPWLRPALSLSYEPAESEPKLGASYLWGSPDIPESESWPKIRELSDCFGAKAELPQDQHCAFVGQIAFSDMQATLLGRELPTDGGFAVFKITEPTHLGIHEALVRPWNNKVPLKRHQAPQELIEDKLGDSCNVPKPPHEITMKEELSLLYASDGPYARASAHSRVG